MIIIIHKQARMIYRWFRDGIFIDSVFSRNRKTNKTKS